MSGDLWERQSRWSFQKGHVRATAGKPRHRPHGVEKLYDMETVYSGSD